MSSIDTYISIIESASRGEDVRDAIIGALESINEEASMLPEPSALDSGKYLRVSSTGEWELATVQSAEGVSF